MEPGALVDGSVVHHASHVLDIAAEWAVLIVEAIAIFVVFTGSVRAFVKLVVCHAGGRGEGVARRIGMDYARWLVAGLTFLLAADILESTVAPSLEDVGRIAVIAVIRTLMSFFLDRDRAAMDRRAHEAGDTA